MPLRFWVFKMAGTKIVQSPGFSLTHRSPNRYHSEQTTTATVARWTNEQRRSARASDQNRGTTQTRNNCAAYCRVRAFDQSECETSSSRREGQTPGRTRRWHAASESSGLPPSRSRFSERNSGVSNSFTGLSLAIPAEWHYYSLSTRACIEIQR
jgi:hypothetical protein